jgi:hypothetical protein
MSKSERTEPAVLVNELLRNVQELTVSGTPGPLVVSEHAIPVVSTQHENAQAALVAASWLDMGRVVAFGHTSFLEQSTVNQHDTEQLLHNAIRWTAQSKSANLRIGLFGATSLAELLRQAGFNCIELQDKHLSNQLAACDVLLVATHAINSASALQQLRHAASNGTGLVAAGLAWGWHQGNQKKAIDLDHPGNQLLQSSGIAFADGYLSANGSTVSTAGSASPLINATQAWQYLLNLQTGKPTDNSHLSQAIASVTLALRYLPRSNNPLMKSAEMLMEEDPHLGLVSASKPLRHEKALERALLTARVVQNELSSPELCKPDPNAASFPGPVERDAVRVSRNVTVNTALPHWHTTALYAAPGEVITVKVPVDAITAKLRVRIGAHSDVNWHHKEWTRSPSVSRVWDLDQSEKKIASSFGGLVFIDVPENCSVPKVDIAISNAVEAPYFKLRETSLADWQQSIRCRPAPWAELAADHVILILPSRSIFYLDNPEPLLQHWNKVLNVQDELCARPLRVLRPERIAADQQISAGYMHSGYPIMTHLDAVPSMVNVEEISQGNTISWGLYHELGHNHQHPEWTFEGTTEVTVNLFTLYTLEKACGLNQGGHNELRYGPTRQAYLQNYHNEGVSFSKWQNNPFLALHMYMQLREGFGWEPYRQLFAEYRILPENERPRTEEEKRDQWMIRFSLNVGKNLAPYFDAWGVPITEGARAKVRHLPPWMPAEWPGSTSQ